MMKKIIVWRRDFVTVMLFWIRNEITRGNYALENEKVLRIRRRNVTTNVLEFWILEAGICLSIIFGSFTSSRRKYLLGKCILKITHDLGDEKWHIYTFIHRKSMNRTNLGVMVQLSNFCTPHKNHIKRTRPKSIDVLLNSCISVCGLFWVLNRILKTFLILFRE